MSEISNTEMLETQADETQKKIHTSLPAKVVSFNAAEQTVQIELMIDQIDYEGNAMPLPPLVDVPVKMFSYGAFWIACEPKAGDEGLAHFAERCIDGWWESSNKSIPLDVRFNDLSDAFFDGGYKSKGNALTIIPKAMHIGSSSAFIRIFEDGIIELQAAALNVNAPTTFAQPVTYSAGMTGKGGIKVNGAIETDTDLVANGKSFLTHTNNGYPID